jgi:small GTP-binding protein
VIGDLGVGKTQLCKTMLGDEFDEGYAPTIFETYKIKVPMFREYPVELWDMSGNDKYERKRPVIYPNVNGFVICFDLTNFESWMNVCNKWLPELLGFSQFPLFIVGCKFDKINASNAKSCVQPSQVTEFMDKHCTHFKSWKFFSTSAQNVVGLETLFAAIIYCTLYEKEKKDDINSSISRLKNKF